VRTLLRTGALAAVLTLALAPAAAGQTSATKPTAGNAVVVPPTLTAPPAGHRLTGLRVLRIADGLANVREVRAHHPRSTRQAFLKGAFQWQVSYYDGPKKEIAQVLIDDATGRVREAWTGFQVPWTMARGYRGAFGRKAAALYVWLPLLVLFVLPFVDPRRPWRLRHLDLLVLVGLSVSLAFFSHGKIGLSVPLAYPVLAYLLARMLVLGVRGPRGADVEPLQLAVPASWLVIGVIFLVGFRVGLNVTNSNVIDVGYSGVIGAHRILHGKALYGAFPADDPRGDTYGPATYLAYVPGVALFGFSGRWDDLPAAHLAAVLFDLLTLAALYALGRRIRGPTLGAGLAWAWAAYPFTLFVSNSNANDSLVALLVVLALLVASSAPARGAAVALAGLTKLAPLALAPLFLRGLGGGRSRGRDALLFLVGFAAAAGLALIPALGEDPGRLLDRTAGFQGSRGSPFSIWGLYGWTGAQRVVQVLAVLLALALLVVPRRRTIVQLAALAAAVLIALQLGVTHWFYLYVVWFFPLVMLAVLAGRPAPEPEPAPARWSSPASVPPPSARARP
jgi:hypothetical protein